MKKLAIAVSIVCATVVAQATSFDWKVGNTAIFDGSGTMTATTIGTVYLFNATDYSQQTLLNALNKGDSFASVQNNAIDSGTLASGVMSKAKDDAETSQYGTYGDKISTYIAVFDEVNGKVFINTTANKDIAADPDITHITAKTDYMMGSMSNNYGSDIKTFANAGWYTAAVPEPTSGLLLLLGVAGLALRRRRA